MWPFVRERELLWVWKVWARSYFCASGFVTGKMMDEEKWRKKEKMRKICFLPLTPKILFGAKVDWKRNEESWKKDSPYWYVDRVTPSQKRLWIYKNWNVMLTLSLFAIYLSPAPKRNYVCLLFPGLPPFFSFWNRARIEALKAKEEFVFFILAVFG